jgi:hypothetical protein
MTKRLPLFFVFFCILSALYGQSPASPLAQLDNAVKETAGEINKKISPGTGQKVLLGAWTYQDSVPPLGSYWAAQLTEELSNIPGRSFILNPSGPGYPDWTLSGEIVEVAGVIRVYTRIFRSPDNAIIASFHSDFERDEYLVEMLVSGGGGGGGGSSSSVSRDVYETDSMGNPLAVTIAASSGGSQINRTIHTGEDEDFFLLSPDRDGALVLETSGSMDTYMELYAADSGEALTEDDDGGSGGNARIRHTVTAGSSYIAKVRGYSHDTGSYGFRAHIVEQVRMTPDEYEEDNDFLSAKDIPIGSAQQHTFTTGDDTDWVKFQISREGRYIIRARGLNSPRLDTYIELYDADRNSIDEDDDGGENLDSRLSVRLQTGTYYLKAECLDDEPDQPYTIIIESE